MVSKENVGIQTTPPRNRDLNMMTLSFLDSSELMSVKGPKTPSPLPKTKILESADQLLSAAERELTSVEAKMSSESLLGAKTSSRYGGEVPCTRRIMTAAPLSPTKRSIFSNSSLKSRSKSSYCVPQNSPSSIKVHGNEDNYKRKNGEKKIVNPKPCPHHTDLKPSNDQSEVNKSSKTEKSDLSKSPAITEFSMFYEQQQLVERKTQSFKEKNSATVIFKSDAKVISSTDVVKHDVETNTSPSTVFMNSQSNNLKFTPNLSIISMKTGKPEEDQPVGFSGKVLNVQKMPSVNIRPGFTIEHGPKINIVGSTSNLYKPKRRNTEFFDIVYPPSSPVFSESSFVSEQGRQNRTMENHMEYICERHTFPSGKLISGTTGENLRQSHRSNNLNLDEKKELLMELIKSVTEKIEKQSSKTKKNCCRLICSLPLLASVVRKIQVDCVKCVDLLNSHLDRLIVLMKEELRGYRELSDDHCCQLDETIHYQIVELELIQEENLKRHSSASITLVKHKESATDIRPPKKTVSFESIPDELAQSTITENRKLVGASNITSSKTGKSSTSGKTSKASFRTQQPSTSKKTSIVFGNIGIKKSTTVKQKLSLHNNNNNRGSGKNINPILKKTDASAKEMTVVSQVLRNLANKKSILKHETVPTKSSNINETRTGLNAFIKMVDQKDTSGEFEKWIQERSIKIRQIHDELNKMVTGSMEEYLENQSSRKEKEKHGSGLTLLGSSRGHLNNEGEDENKSEEENKMRISMQQEEKKNMDNSPDLNAQDAVQEYDEDFEEDEEELPDVNSLNSVSSSQRTIAEAENDSNPSSDNEEVIPDENIGIDETPAPVEKLSSDVSNVTIGGNESPRVPDTDVLRVEKTPVIKISSDASEKSNDCKEKPEKVSIATSPINFKNSSQSVDVSVNTSISHIETRKVTIATSPLNLTERRLSQVKSTMVQTESLDEKETKSVVSNKNNESENGLSIPSVRLNPTPIENIFKVSLDETKENSLALYTNSSNQTLKLIVQLPTLGKSIESKKIIELDCSDQTEKETYTRDVNSDVKMNSNSNASTNLRNESSIPEGSKLYNASLQNNWSEQTIKDIIEPTVSEVLKKIRKFDKSPKNSVCQDEELDKELVNANTSSGLVRPNIFLETKHGIWKKCDENTLLNIVDLEQPNPKIDSSNQTDAEKQDVYIQVADSVAGSVCERASSARKFDTMSDRSRSYLEMLMPPPPSVGTVRSSVSYSSTCHTSSRSSSAVSTSSSRRNEGLHHMEKLSEGELITEECNCKFGDVCEICVPRLDLSFGEFKTKKRTIRMENKLASDSSSDHSKSRHTSVSLSNLPLHIEPRPTSTRTVPSSAPSLTIQSDMDSKSRRPMLNSVRSVDPPKTAPKTERKSTMKQFSEIAQAVLSDLGKELQTFSGADDSKYSFPKPPPPLLTMNFPSGGNQGDTSSSDSLKSSKSLKSLRSKKSCSKHGTKSRASLVIRTPLETPRIDVVIEDPEDVSTSSYQTSVTSVSVDQLPEALSSHSSADASS